jgi:hypothetical protein
VIKIVEVLEFKNVKEINEYFNEHVMMKAFDVKPIARQFEHPKTHNMVNAISYVLIIGN